MGILKLIIWFAAIVRTFSESVIAKYTFISLCTCSMHTSATNRLLCLALTIYDLLLVPCMHVSTYIYQEWTNAIHYLVYAVAHVVYIIHTKMCTAFKTKQRLLPHMV